MKKLLRNWKTKRAEKKAEKKLNNLIKQAEQGRKMTGKQYFVVPVQTRGVKDYILMTNDLHKAYNKNAKKMGKKTIKYSELLEMAVYKTKGGSL